MPSFTGAEFNSCRVQRVPNFVDAKFDQRLPSLTDAVLNGCRVVPVAHLIEDFFLSNDQCSYGLNDGRKSGVLKTEVGTFYK